MGADIHIKVKTKPSFEGIDESIISEDKPNVFYYKDPYSDFCLARVIGKSYWAEFDLNPKEFLIELSKITDEEIQKYVEEKFAMTNATVRHDICEWFKMKRDYLKRLVEADIEDVSYWI